MKQTPPQASLAMAPRDYAALAFLALVWSGSFSLIKVAVVTLPPFSLAAIRLLVAALALLLAMRVLGQRMPGGARAWGVFLVVGLLGNGAPSVLIAFGEQRVDAGLASILMGSMPVTTAVLAHLLFSDEPLTGRRLLGVCCGFAGVVTLVGWDALAGLGGHLLGQVSVLGGALCYALVTLFVRRFGRYPDLAMATGAGLCGAAVMIPMAFLVEQPLALRPSPEAVVSVLLLGLVATAAASLVYFALVRRAGAGNFAQVNYLVPALGVAWGMLLLGESPAPQSFVALGLILGGMWLVTGRARAGDSPA